MTIDYRLVWVPRQSEADAECFIPDGVAGFRENKEESVSMQSEDAYKPVGLVSLCIWQ